MRTTTGSGHDRRLLGNNKEKLYLNAGTFANGSFVQAGSSTLTGSSLDLAVGDFDGDGRYDVATAKENRTFTNRVYRNTGKSTRCRRASAGSPAPCVRVDDPGRAAGALDPGLHPQARRTPPGASLDVTAVRKARPRTSRCP
jgi:hypothetical protein